MTRCNRRGANVAQIARAGPGRGLSKTAQYASVRFPRLRLDKGAAWSPIEPPTQCVPAFNQEPAMSKAQKGNKENKKPKADKNQPRATISAYRTAQGQGKPASSPFARKKI
jgi:hypothetical protein